MTTRSAAYGVRQGKPDSRVFWVEREFLSAAAPQFLMFCAVGALNTLVDIGTYYMLTRFVLGLEQIALSKTVSYLVATLFSFFINRYWTFGRRGELRLAELARFYSTVGLGVFVNVGALYVTVSVFHLNDLLGVLLAAGATALWGFAFSKWYVFGPR